MSVPPGNYSNVDQPEGAESSLSLSAMEYKRFNAQLCCRCMYMSVCGWNVLTQGLKSMFTVFCLVQYGKFSLRGETFHGW